MELKNNHSFLRTALILFLHLSLRLFNHCHCYLQSKTSSVTSSRSIGLFVRFYWPMSCRLFSAASVSLPPSPSLRASSFAIAVVLVWHRSARSNLINSCKFNYWLTAPRLRALYLLLAPLRASTSSCLVFWFFFISFFSFTVPHCEQTHLGVHRFCEPPPRNLQFLGETLWGTRLLVNGRMWDPDSIYMGICGF